ncbi:MAG: Do family serine endopeptidase [Candidatus Aminicenantes bacterium]|nr:Do family serine endopeptidase [Candidatus Aminicenantes bacterium]
MKKYIVTISIGFLLGLIAAGIILQSGPEGSKQTFLSSSPPQTEVSANLFAQTTQAGRPEQDFPSIVEKVGPAVVAIEVTIVEKREMLDFDTEDFWDRFFGIPRGREQEYRTKSYGTGFIISEDGYIVTNNHIVEKAVDVKITTLQENEYKAEIIGTDPRTDVALLKVDAEHLPFVSLGNSDVLRVGEWVLAIGNPLGFAHTVTAGIVSAKERQRLPGVDIQNFQDYIQTDAAINRGNSGGPLVNMLGEVVGINSLIYSATGGNIGIGFAIPSSLAQKVVVQLKENGRVIRGWLGVGIYPVDDKYQEVLGLESKKGAVINNIDPDSPAEKAGLKKYDVILAINGVPIEDNADLMFKIADTKPGTEIEIIIVRDKKKMTVKAKVGEAQAEEELESESDTGKDLGISITELTPGIARRYGFQTESGVVITEVRRFSVAEENGLAVGDIILEVNREEIISVEDFEKILNKLDPGDAVLMLIRRESRDRTGRSEEFMLTLRIPE